MKTPQSSSKIDTGPQGISHILNKRTPTIKPPAYEWQDLALRLISELGVPNFKRNSVFKVCKQYPKIRIEQALNDTRELCRDGEAWKYFFKVLASVPTANELNPDEASPLDSQPQTAPHNSKSPAGN
ncbi:MAG: hypothetical protein KBB55_01200 [Candidatus Buchananbacteria bacterium]|nr:hypothetical protein [Candidatus Buchananbacteria bacterium]